MSELKASVVITAVDRMTKTVQRITSVNDRLGSRAERTGEKLTAMGNQKKTMAAFKTLSERSSATAKELSEAQDKARSLGKQISATEKPSKNLQKQFDRERASVKPLKESYQAQQSQLNKMRTELGHATKSTGHMQAAQAKLKREVEQTEKVLVRQKKAIQSWNKAKEKTLESFSTARRGVMWGAGLLAGGTFAFNRTFVKTGAEFERFEAILKTIEGSSEKAKASMSWISDFAAKTPFEIDGVTESFVKLRAYGMDPMKGDLLKTLGDTSAAMGKPLEQAVEAIADAVTGENERLKEFGIKAKDAGNQVVYEYTVAGKTMRKAADKSSREMIQTVLQSIWNEKYAGAMDEQSRTWIGMMSNVSDQWTRFQVKVMQAGVLDKLKGKLGGVLDRLNQLADSGKLDEIAVDVAQRIMIAVDRIWDAANKLYTVFISVSSAMNNIANLFGGWENFIYVLIASKFVGWAISVAAAITSIGLAAKGSAAGLGLLSIAGEKMSLTKFGRIAGSAGLLYGAWEAGQAIGGVINNNLSDDTKMDIGRLAAQVMAALGSETAKNALKNDPEAQYESSASSRTRQRAHLKIEVSDDRVKVKEISADGFGMDVSGVSMLPGGA